jgi:REP element-mobilizing transposase RayT
MGRHDVFLTHTHLIFITKYRGEIVDDDLLNYREQRINSSKGVSSRKIRQKSPKVLYHWSNKKGLFALFW